MDQRTVQQRVLKRLLTRPSVLVPGLLGIATVGLGALAGANSAGFFLFMGLSGIAISGLSAFVGLTFGTKRETQRVMDEMIRGQEQSEVQTYDRLRQRLLAAGDDEAASHVDQLERLAQRVERGRAGDGFTIPLEMLSMVQSLRDACLQSLRRSAQILETMGELTTDEVRAEMGAKRNKIENEVERSIERLALALDRMQTSTFRGEDASDLARVRDTLEAGLETARRVDDRIARIEQELGQRFDGAE